MNIYEVLNYLRKFNVDRNTWSVKYAASTPSAPTQDPAQAKAMLAQRLLTYADRLWAIESEMIKLDGSVDAQLWSWWNVPGHRIEPQARAILSYQRKVLSVARHYITAYARALQGDAEGMKQAYTLAKEEEQKARQLGAALSYTSSNTWGSSWAELFGRTSTGYPVFELLGPAKRQEYQALVGNIAELFTQLNADLEGPHAQALGPALDNLKKYTQAFVQATEAPHTRLFEPGKYSPPALPVEDIAGAEKAIKKPSSGKVRSISSPFAGFEPSQSSSGTTSASPSAAAVPPQALAAMFGMPMGGFPGFGPPPSNGKGSTGPFDSPFGMSAPFAGPTGGMGPFGFV